MHAIVVENLGNARFVADWREPKIVNETIQIRVRACGLNFADLLMIEGKYQETPDVPFVPGMEICGEIIALPANINSKFTIGQRIIAFCGAGGLAEIAAVEADRCLAIPDDMDDVTAAGFQIAYGTSHLALTKRASLVKGETLVVLGAAGGVGLTAVEVGKNLGARVIAVARGREKLDIAANAGADFLIDADTDDLLSELKAHGPTNVIYDPVGGAPGEAALRSLGPGGRHLLIGFASGDLPKLKPNHLMVKNVDVIGFYWGGYLKFDRAALIDSLAELTRWHSAGKLQHHVSTILPFDQALEGLELLRARKATGKIVITL